MIILCLSMLKGYSLIPKSVNLMRRAEKTLPNGVFEMSKAAELPTTRYRR